MSSSFVRTCLTNLSSKGKFALTIKEAFVCKYIWLTLENGRETICVSQNYKNDSHFNKYYCLIFVRWFTSL